MSLSSDIQSAFIKEGVYMDQEDAFAIITLMSEDELEPQGFSCGARIEYEGGTATFTDGRFISLANLLSLQATYLGPL